MYYTYIYLNPLIPVKFNSNDLNFEFEPFYVGKGSKSRYLQHLRNAKKDKLKIGENFYKIGIIRKILNAGLEPIILIDSGFDNESLAFEREKYLIASIGRVDNNTGTLVNFTDGGEGTSGRVWSKETMVKMKSYFNKVILCYDLNGNFLSEYLSITEAAKKLKIDKSGIIINLKLRTDRCLTYIFKYKFSDRFLLKIEGYVDKRIGFVFSKERNSKISNCLRGIKRSEETKLKISKLKTGIKDSDETKLKKSKAQKGKFSELRKLSLKKASDSNKKKVNKIDLITGVVVETFDSIMSASNNINNGKNVSSSITSVCNGKQKTAYNFKWEYLN